jgi:hypothetical protein
MLLDMALLRRQWCSAADNCQSTFTVANLTCRDLALGAFGSPIALLAGGAAAFAPVTNNVQVFGDQQLIANSAATRVYAIAARNRTLLAYTVNGPTLEALSSVRRGHCCECDILHTCRTTMRIVHSAFLMIRSLAALQ